jgi:hypothetical protein
LLLAITVPEKPRELYQYRTRKINEAILASLQET